MNTEFEPEAIAEVNSLHAAAEQLVLAKRHAILMVEDTAAHALLVRRGLDTTVWQVEHVTRASDAIRSFELDPNRIVLLDLSLPDAEGTQLLQRLHKINPLAPIVVVTAIDQVKVSVQAMQRGASDYVVKSNPQESIPQILEAISAAWQRRLQAAERNLIEQSRMNELLRAERLEAMEQVIRSVLSEVNNPLSGMMILGQLLAQRKDLDNNLQRLAEGIIKSASEVARVVDKLKLLNTDRPIPEEKPKPQLLGQ